MKTRNYVLLAFLLAFGASANGQMLADYQFSTGHDPSLWYTLDSTRNLLVDGSVYYRRSYIENIGFDFPFADTSYSQFSVTLAGVLRLGGTRALTTSGYQGSPFHPSNLNKNLRWWLNMHCRPTPALRAKRCSAIRCTFMRMAT